MNVLLYETYESDSNKEDDNDVSPNLQAFTRLKTVSCFQAHVIYSKKFAI